MAGKKTNTTEKPWYDGGLKFKCTGCGDCCTGAEGYVWVNQEEIANLATLMNQTVDEFEDMYVRRIGARKSLKELPVSFDCVFFDSDSRKCQVYEARPRQCRTWPFWDSNVRTPEQWKRTCEVCPGSGTGKLYSLGEIEQQRSILKI
jgi:Fe-S-cluster containining protein